MALNKHGGFDYVEPVYEIDERDTACTCAMCGYLMTFKPSSPLECTGCHAKVWLLGIVPLEAKQLENERKAAAQLAEALERAINHHEYPCGGVCASCEDAALKALLNYRLHHHG